MIPTTGAPTRSPKRVTMWLILLLGAAVTALFAVAVMEMPSFDGTRYLLPGGTAAAAIAVLLMVNAVNRTTAEALRGELDEIRTGAPSTGMVRMTAGTVPATIALVGGAACTAIIHRNPSALGWLPGTTTFVATAVALLLTWALALAGAANDRRLGRLAIEVRGAVMGASLGAEALWQEKERHEEEIAAEQARRNAETGDLIARIARHDEEGERLRHELESESRAATEAREELAGTRDEVGRLTTELEVLRAQHTQLTGENRGLHRSVDALQQLVRRLEAEEAAAREAKTRSDEALAAARSDLEGGRHGMRLTPDPTPAAFAPPVFPSDAAAPRAAAVVDPAIAAGAEAEAAAPAGAEAGAGPQPRPLPRLPLELLHSSLGEVTELGSDGMRVTCSKVPHDRVIVQLPDGNGTLDLEAEAVESARLSRGRHDVLLVFFGVTPEIRRRIVRIAMRHRRRSVLPINSIATD